MLIGLVKQTNMEGFIAINKLKYQKLFRKITTCQKNVYR